MKKNRLSIILSIIFIVVFSSISTSCKRCNSDEEDGSCNHNFVQELFVDATCTTNGIIKYKCSICNTTKEEIINAKQHKLVTDYAVSPTCTTVGLTEGIHCSECEYVVPQVEIPALGHSYESKITAPTCTEKGFTTYTCHCGDIYVELYVDALGHTYSDWIVEKEATCTEDGLERRECINCEYYEEKVVEHLGHDLIHHEALIPTCTEPGHNEYDTCSRCDYTTYQELSELGHLYKSVITDSTCTKQGYTTHTCERCDDIYVDSYVDALGHDYEKTEIKPTYQYMGYTINTCKICGDSYTDNEVEPLKCIITWKNYDGTILKIDEYKYGDTPVYSDSNPVRPADYQYTYTFIGWNKEISPATCSEDYIAVYDSKENIYNVTWKDQNDNILKSLESVAYQDEYTYDLDLPKIDDTEKYTYTFKGWDKYINIENLTIIYIAIIEESVKTYFIEWLNPNGNVLYSGYFEYGSNPTYKGNTPSYDPNDGNKYIFDGWTNTISNVEKDEKIYAKYILSYTETALQAYKNELAEISSYGNKKYKWISYLDRDYVQNEFYISFSGSSNMVTITYYAAEMWWEGYYRYIDFSVTKINLYGYDMTSHSVQISYQKETAYDSGRGAETIRSYNANAYSNIDASFSTSSNISISRVENFGMYPFDNYTLINRIKSTVDVVLSKMRDNGVNMKALGFTNYVNNSSSSNKYKLFLDTNGGQTYISKIENIARIPDNLPTPTKYGYEFNGWYLDSNFSTLATSGTKLTSNKTLYAKWIAKTFEINYDLDGGSADNKFKYTIDDEDFTLSNPTRKGYIFTGWTGSNSSEPELSVLVDTSSCINLSYIATWIPDKYTVTYDLNGGDENNQNTLIVTFDDNYELYSPTRHGYFFGGWYYGEGLLENNGIWTISNDILLVADWIPIDYSISYDLDGGTAENVEIYNIETNTFTLSNPIKKGYTFTGWTGSNGEELQEIVTISIGSIGDLSFKANWKAVKYIITYDVNKGSTLENNQQIVIYDESFTLISASRDNYDFSGWYYEEELFTNNGIWTIAENITLVAKWTPHKFEITFNNHNDTNDEILEVEYDGKLPNKTKPSKYGYKFLGYYDSEDGGMKYYSEDMGSEIIWNLDKNITLHAQWEIYEHYIMFDSNEGQGEQPSLKITYGSNLPTLSLIPTKVGYVFSGYYNTQNGKQYYSSDLTPQVTWDKEDNFTLYAQYEPINYYVVFDANGGTGKMDKQSIIYDVSTSIMEVLFEFAGYSFVEWNTISDGSGLSYKDKTNVLNLCDENNEEIILYAQWAPNQYNAVIPYQYEYEDSYNVYFDLDGGTPDLPAQTVTAERGISYPRFIPEKQGYIFVGWYDSETNGKTLYDFSKTIEKDIFLRAKWIVNNGYKFLEPPVDYQRLYTAGYNYNYYYFTCFETGNYTINISNVSRDIYMRANINHGNYFINEVINYGYYNSTKSYSFYAESGDVVYISLTNYITSSSQGSLILTLDGPGFPSGIGYAKTDYIGYIERQITFDSDFYLPCNLTKKGYSFVGWYYDENGTEIQYTDSDGYSVRPWDKTENATLYPKWNKNYYTITFESNGGSEIETIRAPYNSEIVLPDNPSYPQKSFVGWYDITLTNEFDLITMPNENITLYAKWIEYEVTLTSDDITEISVYDNILDYTLYNAEAIDTDGNSIDVTVQLISETQEAGNSITVRLVANGLYGLYDVKTLRDIKVYGNPVITYDEEKDYINLTDTLDSSLFDVIALDTYENSLDVTVTVVDEEYYAGSLVTVSIKATDVTGNETEILIENIKVYGNPIITYNKELLEISITDEISNEFFIVTAKDSFGVEITAETRLYSGTFSAGNIIEVISESTDTKGNYAKVVYEVKVYGCPLILNPTNINVKDIDEITLELLGIVVIDSFDNLLDNVILTTLSGNQTAGTTMSFEVIAVDHLGNTSTTIIENIMVYGIPDITYNYDKTEINTSDIISSELFNAIGIDSFNSNIDVSTTIVEGEQTGGSVIKILFETEDSAGNKYSFTTENIRVYDGKDMILTYNKYLSNMIRKDSVGAEFNAYSTDSFGEVNTINIIPAEGFELKGGNTINLYIEAIDKVGNSKRSEIISNINIYDTPELKYLKNTDYIHANDNPYELFKVTDSFGNELLYDVEIVSGSLDVNNKIIYKITAKDRLNNILEQEYELVVLLEDESFLKLYYEEEFIGDMRISKGDELIILNYFDYDVVWLLEDTILTNTEGYGLTTWKYDSAVYTLIARETPIICVVNLDINEGDEISFDSQDVAYDSSYSLPIPTKKGCTFEGWYDGTNEEANQYTDTEGNSLSNFEDLKNITLYAKWEYIDYEIKFDSNGGTNIQTIIVNYGDQISLLTPLKSSMKFVGWYFENEKWENNLIFNEERDVVLVARYIDSSLYSTHMYFGKYPQTQIKTNDPIYNKLKTAKDIDGDGYIEYMGREYVKAIAKHQPNYNSEFTAGQAYYFEVEPILWEIKNDGMLISVSILDSMAMYNSTSTRKYNDQTIQPNNYNYSIIRAFLNSYDGTKYNVNNYSETGFYSKAFSNTEKNIIQNTYVDNSVSTTGYSSNEYVCSSQVDKVFLLSYSQIKSLYGTYYGSVYKTVTDYARSQGLILSSYDKEGCASWWLRSPDADDFCYSRHIDGSGTTYNTHKVTSAYYGVVPSLFIKI